MAVHVCHHINADVQGRSWVLVLAFPSCSSEGLPVAFLLCVLGYMAHRLLEFFCPFPLRNAGIKDTFAMYLICTAVLGIQAGPHACMESILPTKPSPQLPISGLLWFMGYQWEGGG